jgi:hypothetical protein
MLTGTLDNDLHSLGICYSPVLLSECSSQKLIFLHTSLFYLFLRFALFLWL